MKKIALVVVLILTLSWLSGYAEEVVSPQSDFYYYDEVGVLSEETEGEIFFSNKLLYEDCGAQIVVVVINSTGSYSIEDYCIKLFNQWGIGDAEKNNGFLLLLAIQDDDYYACPGLGLEPQLSTTMIKALLDGCLEDDFVAKRYDRGVKKFYEAIFAYMAMVYHSDITVQDGIKMYEDYKAESSATDFKWAQLSWNELMLLLQRNEG